LASQIASGSYINRGTEELNLSKASMDPSEILEILVSHEQSSPRHSVWHISNYIGARFRGSKDAVTTEITRVINLQLAATGQTITQQQSDKLIDTSLRRFNNLPRQLHDDGHDFITPQDFDELMDKLIQKQVSQHKLKSIRLSNEAVASSRILTQDQERPKPKQKIPLPPRPPPNGPKPISLHGWFDVSCSQVWFDQVVKPGHRQTRQEGDQGDQVPRGPEHPGPRDQGDQGDQGV
jgi:hypothetical protein